jgi:hypothetical protein
MLQHLFPLISSVDPPHGLDLEAGRGKERRRETGTGALRVVEAGAVAGKEKKVRQRKQLDHDLRSVLLVWERQECD